MSNFFDHNLNFLLEKQGISPEDFSNELKVSLNGARIYVDDLIKISEHFNLTLDQLLKTDIANLSELGKDIKLLILDVDGVLTDGGMYFSALGDEQKRFDTKDGRGVISYVKSGGQVGIISSGFKNEIVMARAKMLGIQNVYVGTDPKESILEKWIYKLDITWRQVAFIGDDINDLEVMKKVGLSACPNNAVDDIKAISDVILKKDGGHGCVREFIDRYLHKAKMYNA